MFNRGHRKFNLGLAKTWELIRWSVTRLDRAGLELWTQTWWFSNERVFMQRVETPDLTCSFSVNIASYFVFVPPMEKIPKEESLHVSKQHSSGVPERISVLNESNDSMTHLWRKCLLYCMRAHYFYYFYHKVQHVRYSNSGILNECFLYWANIFYPYPSQKTAFLHF